MFEIKIKVSDPAKLQNCGWSRNAIFRIIEGGGEVEGSGLMAIYQSLEGNAKYDFATRLITAASLERAELEKLLKNHKRSNYIRMAAAVKQHALSSEEANDFFERFAGNFIKKCNAVQEASKFSWGSPGRNLGQFSSLFEIPKDINFINSWISNSSNKGASPPRSIDSFSAEKLYEISMAVARGFDTHQRNNMRVYLPWWTQSYIGAICSGTRTSPLAPLMYCDCKAVSDKATKAYLYILDNGGS